MRNGFIASYYCTKIVLISHVILPFVPYMGRSSIGDLSPLGSFFTVENMLFYRVRQPVSLMNVNHRRVNAGMTG